MSNKKYWQSFGELNQTEAFKKTTEDEFKEELLPVEELSKEGLLTGSTTRRDFLKYLGFSTAAAAVAASCEMPVRKSVPYLNRPDNVIPGVANYYASTYVNGGDAISVVVKQRDGRPIKIEGNELSPITQGGTHAQVQASVLDLYDTTRLRHPLQKDGADFKEVSTFDAMDKMVADAMANLGGKSVVLLTSTIHSPSTLKIIESFVAKYKATHIQYDAVSYSGMLLANEACYGTKAIPSYQFDKATTIVSLGADFLGTWLSPVEFSKQYAANRKITGEKPAMSRHFQFESMLSLTGSNADDRYTHKPSETGAIALALLAKLDGAVSAPSIADAKLKAGIDKAAEALLKTKGASLVVCGSNDANIQTVVNAINELVGANGTTINWTMTNNTRKGVDADMAKLEADLASGSVGALLVYNCNPVYTYSKGKKLAEAIAKLPVSISFNGTMDETTEQCKYIIPSHHWLESWGDAEPKSGIYSFSQPLINPLFKTRAFQTSLLKWTGGSTIAVAAAGKDSTAAKAAPAPVAGGAVTEYETYLTKYWSSSLGEAAWTKALQDGVLVRPVSAAAPAYKAPAIDSAKLTNAKGGAVEVVLYQKVGMGTGAQANNPWLQELPDPISKVTWDNYAMVSPELAKTLIGIDVLNNQRQADAYEVTPEKPVIKISANGNAIELPVLIIPGLNNATIAVAVGYGRASADEKKSLERVGRSATNAGKNAYPLAGFDGQTVSYSVAATAEKTGKVYPLAQTQVHGSSEQKTRSVFYETSLAAFTKNPEEVLREITEEKKGLMAHGKENQDFVKEGTIYPTYDRPGVKWGMNIDLNTCTGCSACVVACTAENNVAVVGKIQVQRAHEMHWLRIDRYFTGNDPKNPDVVFQPMMCQHCDNAPCENVCPVAATNHSSEGLNQMTYNRCIGTRYCANNCPFKVRRFNWLDYTGSDSFANNQEPLRGKDLDEAVFQMNDDLTRMVLNPDVTVRSRGVIEKCSFCVQRLQESKLDAKKHEDPSKVRNVKTACMQACPTNAIQFGNVNDSQSEVAKARSDKHRTFYVLDHLHVLPNVSYLAKVRNTDRVLGGEETAGEKAHG